VRTTAKQKTRRQSHNPTFHGATSPGLFSTGLFSTGLIKLIDLRRQDEITFRQALDFMRPNLDSNFPISIP
jgi:hypothetical protein